MQWLSFKDADEIADGFDPIDDIVPDFNAEPIFDHDHQFEAVEPVGPEILAEVCFIGDALGVYAQMLGNEAAGLDGDGSDSGADSRYATHGLVRIAAAQPREPSMQLCPPADRAQKFSECGIGVTSVVHPTQGAELVGGGPSRTRPRHPALGGDAEGRSVTAPHRCSSLPLSQGSAC